jgi:hypothetical protein
MVNVDGGKRGRASGLDGRRRQPLRSVSLLVTLMRRVEQVRERHLGRSDVAMFAPPTHHGSGADER